MKKLMLSVLSGVFLVALFAMAQTEVASINIVGYSKTSFPSNRWIMVAANFDKVGGGTNTLLDVFGTNQLRQAGNLTLCDKVTVWNPTTQKYQTYAQYTDGVFYKANTGVEWGSGIVANASIPVGTAMWVVPGAGASSNKTLNVMGQVVLVATQKVDIIPGWQMVSYPFTSDMALSNSGFFASGAARAGNLTLCDKVTIWSGTNYQTYALYTDQKWYLANDGVEWAKGIVASNTIGIAQGFWYVSQSNMVWTETNKYLHNL